MLSYACYGKNTTDHIQLRPKYQRLLNPISDSIIHDCAYNMYRGYRLHRFLFLKKRLFEKLRYLFLYSGRVLVKLPSEMPKGLTKVSMPTTSTLYKMRNSMEMI